MVKTERNEIVKVSGKGKLMSINEEGITLLDLKEGSIDVIKFSDLAGLIGKEVTIAIQNKEEV